MNRQTLLSHLLQALAKAQFEGRISSLETLALDVGARRADVRTALSALHREGYLDVLRMRLTLAGFAIGRALAEETLPSFRATAEATVATIAAA